MRLEYLLYFIKLIPMSGWDVRQCCWWCMGNNVNGTPNIFLEISLILIWCEICVRFCRFAKHLSILIRQFSSFIMLL